MIALIIGIIDSGKSDRAEALAVKLSGGGEKIYIATMIPYGDEGHKRIKKHRDRRKGKGFITVECPVKVHRLCESIDGISEATCLLECMSNLIANEMHEKDNMNMPDKELSEHIVSSVMSLAEGCRNLIIVSNVFSHNDDEYDEDTYKYIRLADMVNDALKCRADMLLEYVEGEWVLREDN